MGLFRFYLACVVAIGHYRFFVLRPLGSNENDAPYLFLASGWMDAGHAVMLFYLISGFLISYSLKYKYSHRPLLDFYKARFMRIYPLYWTLAFFTIYLSGNLFGYLQSKSYADLFFGFTLLGADWVQVFTNYPKIYWAVFPPLLNPAWSLACEMTFYLLAPFLLRSHSIALIALLFSMLLRWFLIFYTDGGEVLAYHFFPATACFFLTGHFARVIYERFNTIGILNFAFLIPFFILAKMGQTSPTFDNKYFYGYFLCAALFIPYLFDLTKNSKLLNKLGELSYPIYLSHTIVLSFLFFSPKPLLISGSYYSYGPQGLVIFLLLTIYLSFSLNIFLDQLMKFFKFIKCNIKRLRS
jgi:peptidoglycan/LPS O-acetylase OafA/YrhL